MGDVLQWDQSNKNYMVTLGFSKLIGDSVGQLPTSFYEGCTK